MTRVDEHVTRLERPNPNTYWCRWVCTCGRRSKLFGFAGLAQHAADTHVRAYGVRVTR